MDKEELNLTVYIMPCKHSVTVSVDMNDTIGKMKDRLSVTSGFLSNSFRKS